MRTTTAAGGASARIAAAIARLNEADFVGITDYGIRDYGITVTHPDYGLR